MSAPADWTALPLDGDGRSLVEASAGTGKTWTIAVLYLRLLLEQRLSPRQIVVSTFTNAAAAELGERLRGKLLWALAEADKHRQGLSSDEEKHPDCHWLRKRWREEASRLEGDVRRLQAALAEFDAAPIATLHALCARILAEHPFAAGALFGGREMVDGKALAAALAADLWRVVAQGGAEDELVVLARAAGIDRSKLEKYVPALLQANVVVEGLEPAFLRERLGFLGDLDAWAAKVRGLLDDDRWFGKRCALRQVWRNLVDTIAPLPSVVPGDLDLARLEGATALTAISKAGAANPDIQALARESVRIAAALTAEEWDRAGSVALRRFLAAAQRWCREVMQARLEAANQCSFDQLLLSVRAALAPRDGQRALADALFAAWPVALVDEFQDTDPVQFGILDAIYRDAAGAPRGRLVMIGDPKQAIYRFRGGDVQAYVRARAAVPAAGRLTLDMNFRSSRGYVEAVNHFYAATGEGLGPAGSSAEIRYQAVRPSGRRDDAPLRFASSGEAVTRPLVLHELAADDDAPDLEAKALRACAGQIVRVLSADGYRIGETPLQPGDIAVLLPGHAQIARLAAMLKARGVPCVTGSQQSVFATDSARELRLLLHAVLHPDDPRTLRAALATRLGGINLGGLQALRHDAAAWDRHAARFHALRGVLETGGPLALVAALLDEHGARLLDTVAGERMLTDLRHLGELLQTAWDDCGSGERLAAWFADQMRDGTESSEAAEARALRLESDAARVQLLTLHASKGLEFGVVFLPLMWKHARSKSSERAPHLLSAAHGDLRYLVEGPAREIVKRQEYEERFRILYVALTRAIHACHLFVLPQEGPLAAAVEKAGKAKEVPLNALDLSSLKAAPCSERIDFVAGWDAHPGLHWRGEAAVDAPRVARALPALPPGPLPMRHSFTTLSGGGRRRVSEEGGAAEDEAVAANLLPDGDVEPMASAAADAGAGGPTFHSALDDLASVGGTDFGNAIHAVFEQRLPGRPIEKTAVLAALREHGVRPRQGDVESLLLALVRRLNAALETPLGGPGGPRLCELGAADLRAEMEFNYRLDHVSLRALHEACAQHGEPHLVPLREQTLAGLMNGKIDLVFAHGGRFHVLDYKGNQLARGAQACLEDYAPAALQATMAAAGYRFQALLYTVALERYLRERLGGAYRRAQHLGDCWYLFVRAVGLALPDGTPCGVWHHRFGDGLLDAVQSVLGAAQQEAA